MNGFSTAATSSNSPIPPPGPTSETNRPSFPAIRPEFSSFKFKNIGQPPTLLSRFTGVTTASDYRSPSPEPSDMDVASSEDPMMVVSDDHRTFHPIPRKPLLDRLGGNADQGHNPKPAITHAQDPGVVESITRSPPSASSFHPVLPRPESRLSSISRQLSGAVDVSRADPASSLASVPVEIHTHEPPDLHMVDLYADPDSQSRSPLSIFSDLSEAVRESAELDRITSLHRILTAEREELLRRHEETARALSRTKAQLDHVLSLTDEAIKMTTVFVDKEKARLETKKTKAEAKIEHRKNLETEQRRKVKELERLRQQEEERKAQAEMEQAERQRLEEQRRKQEALAAERQRMEEIQARERAQAEERRRLEEERNRAEEERRRLAEENQRKRDEEEQRRQEEEHHRRRLAEEREAMARKQEEDRKTQLLERRRLAEEERRKEAEIAVARAQAEKHAADREQQRIFQERRATALKDKYKNYNRPEFGIPSTGPPPTLEGTPRNRDTPIFVPATTEAGKLPPDLSQEAKASDDFVDHAVKHETTSPVIPFDNAEPAGSTSIPSRPVSSMSTTALAPSPTGLPAPPHLPAKPVTVYSQPPVLPYQRGRSPHRYPPPRRSGSRSPSSSRSPRRGSSRLSSRSPEPFRGRRQSPSAGPRGDHYSPPRQHYRDGGSRYGHESRSDSPPSLPNPRKRPLQDPWSRVDTPGKLDYSHPSKRRAASPFRSRSPPSPQSRPLTQPPIVVSARRPPQSGRRGRGGGGAHVPLEQRLSRPSQPHLSERIR
jgi:hypothetical protein